MVSCLFPFPSLSIVFVLFVLGAYAETFPPSQVVWSTQYAYSFCKSGGLGWYPYETLLGCRQRPLVVSPGSPAFFILCYDNMEIGLTRTSGNGSSIEPFGLIPRSGNLTLQITDPQVNITFESRCENPAPAETIAQKNSWKLPNNANPGTNIFGPCCAIEFNVPANYIGDLYYQSSSTDLFFGQIIIEANVTSTTTTTPNSTSTPPSTTPNSGTTTSGTTTTSTTTTTPPVPTSTPLPPNATTAVPTANPSPTPTPTVMTSTTSPPTTINSTNNAANFASGSLTAYSSCTVLTMLIVILVSNVFVL